MAPSSWSKNKDMLRIDNHYGTTIT